MPKGVYKHKSNTNSQNLKIGRSISILWAKKRKGKTYEEIFGKKASKLVRHKMSIAKIGRKMPWNKVKPSGKFASRWIKDRTKIKGRHTRSFHDPCYRQWRRDVFVRDKSQCRLEDSLCKGRLEVHHIRSWHTHSQLRYKINNGITLCHAHHPRIRAEEKRLRNYLTTLVSVSK